MHKLWLLLAFVLLSRETRGFRIKRQSGDWTEGPHKQNGNSNPTSNRHGDSESIILQDCLESCPVTSEYNPVCGTNNVTYDNPGRLICAQSCGVNVTKMSSARCSVVFASPAA